MKERQYQSQTTITIFSCAYGILCPWQCIPLKMKSYKRFVPVKAEACCYLLYLDSLEIKGLHVQQQKRKGDCVFNYFEHTQNEHRWY